MTTPLDKFLLSAKRQASVKVHQKNGEIILHYQEGAEIQSLLNRVKDISGTNVSILSGMAVITTETIGNVSGLAVAIGQEIAGMGISVKVVSIPDRSVLYEFQDGANND